MNRLLKQADRQVGEIRHFINHERGQLVGDGPPLFEMLGGEHSNDSDDNCSGDSGEVQHSGLSSCFEVSLSPQND